MAINFGNFKFGAQNVDASYSYEDGKNVSINCQYHFLVNKIEETVIYISIWHISGYFMSWREVIRRWLSDRDFCTEFSRTLARAEYQAFFWETAPCTFFTLEHKFEMVLVNSRSLADTVADFTPFCEHLVKCWGSSSVAAFPNLLGDAMLVAPCPLIFFPAAYAHIAAFARIGPHWQKIEFWSTVAKTLCCTLLQDPKQPYWVSTSGLGVQWLHARIEARPKYYQYKPFKQRFCLDSAFTRDAR